MDTTVRNLDEQTYRAIRARAVLEGRTVGELLNEAMRYYLAHSPFRERKSSLREWKPEPFPEGNENLSSEIDTVVYSGRP